MRAGDLVLIFVIVALLLLVAGIDFQNPGEIVNFFFGLLFNPTAGLILLIVIVEFLWLKSYDRTRIYKLEADRLRELRKRDEKLLRRAREVIDQAVSNPETEEEGRPGDWLQRAKDTAEDIKERL